MLARILPFFDTHSNSTLFRYSQGQVFITGMDITFFGNSHGFYLFSVLTLIQPISDIRWDKFWILARILHFSDTRPDAFIFRYSHSFDHFPVLVRTIFRYSHGFYLFPILAQILPFFGTHTNSTIFRYSLGQLFDTRTDSTFFGYSPGLYHFSVLTLNRPFSGSRRDNISILARNLPFAGGRPDSTIFRYSQ